MRTVSKYGFKNNVFFERVQYDALFDFARSLKSNSSRVFVFSFCSVLVMCTSFSRSQFLPLINFWQLLVFIVSLFVWSLWRCPYCKCCRNDDHPFLDVGLGYGCCGCRKIVDGKRNMFVLGNSSSNVSYFNFSLNSFLTMVMSIRPLSTIALLIFNFIIFLLYNRPIRSLSCGRWKIGS